MSLTTRIGIDLAATLTSALDLGSRSAPLPYGRSVSLASGTAAGQADLIFHDRRTLAASATEDLDLAGVLTDPFGGTLTFARIKALLISASAANTNSVIVGAASATQWATLLNAAGTVTLRPGGMFVAVAGDADASAWAVTATTGDLLKVANSAGSTSVTYDIVAIGCSA